MVKRPSARLRSRVTSVPCEGPSRETGMDRPGRKGGWGWAAEGSSPGSWAATAAFSDKTTDRRAMERMVCLHMSCGLLREHLFFFNDRIVKSNHSGRHGAGQGDQAPLIAPLPLTPPFA